MDTPYAEFPGHRGGLCVPSPGGGEVAGSNPRSPELQEKIATPLFGRMKLIHQAEAPFVLRCGLLIGAHLQSSIGRGDHVVERLGGLAPHRGAGEMVSELGEA